MIKKEFLKAAKETYNVGLVCGGRTAGRTYEQFLQIYKMAKLKGYDEITIRFYEPETAILQQRIDKAIKYIEKETFLDYERGTSHDLYDTQIIKVIKILKGESNE